MVKNNKKLDIGQEYFYINFNDGVATFKKRVYVGDNVDELILKDQPVFFSVKDILSWYMESLLP